MILYRGYDFERDEKIAAEAAGFICTNSRMDIQKGDWVLGRYSVLPYFSEQERDIRKAGAVLANTHAQHQYIADMRNWYADLEGLTPKTWFRLQDVPKDEAPYFVKGATNSKKFLWDTLAYAPDWESAGNIYSALQNDGLIGEQDLYVRKFVPLHTYMRGIRGLPITKEFRFFTLYGEVVSAAYYWSSHAEDVIAQEGSLPSANEVPNEFVSEVLRRIGDNANAVVVDFAQTADGRWIVIELNDLMMSGLSENKPEVLYPNMMRVLKAREVSSK